MIFDVLVIVLVIVVVEIVRNIVVMIVAVRIILNNRRKRSFTNKVSNQLKLTKTHIVSYSLKVDV